MRKREVPPEKAATVAVALVRGKSQREALTEAGYAQSVARTPAEVIRSPMVQRALRVALEVVGISSEMIAGTIKDAMQANRIEVGRTGGAITDIREVGPDHATRLKAAAMAAEIHEGYRRKWCEAADGPRMVINLGEHKGIFFADPNLKKRQPEIEPPDTSRA